MEGYHPHFLEIYRAIESQNISLLQSLLANEEYIVHLDYSEERWVYGSVNEGYEDPLLLAVYLENIEI